MDGGDYDWMDIYVWTVPLKPRSCKSPPLPLQVHATYRTTGASFERAQQEFATGVMSNKTVQTAAANAATRAAQGTFKEQIWLVQRACSSLRPTLTPPPTSLISAHPASFEPAGLFEHMESPAALWRSNSSGSREGAVQSLVTWDSNRTTFITDPSPALHSYHSTSVLYCICSVWVCVRVFN